MDPKVRELIGAWLSHVKKNGISDPTDDDLKDFLISKKFDSDVISQTFTAAGLDNSNKNSNNTVLDPDAEKSQAGTHKTIPDNVVKASDNKYYQWLGKQWAVYNPTTGKAGQIANKKIAAELNQKQNKEPDVASPNDDQKVDEPDVLDTAKTLDTLSDKERELYGEMVNVISNMTEPQKKMLAKELS